jgi:hypothetical protein
MIDIDTKRRWDLSALHSNPIKDKIMKTIQKSRFAISILFLCVAVLSTSCGDDTVSGGPNIAVMDMAPEDKVQTGDGVFTGYAHDLSGKASLFCGDDGSKTIRLQDFNMLAGPDVYVYISKSNNYSQANVIEVTKLTSGYMNSDINFAFKSTSFTSEYKFVLVYCVQFNSLFGYAELE